MGKILACIFSALFLASAVSGAQAQVKLDKLDEFGAKLLGAAKPAQYAEELEAAVKKMGDPKALAAAARAAALYVLLARSARTPEEIKIVDALRGAFDESASMVIRAVSAMAAAVESTTIGKELDYVYGQARKIVADPAAAAQFLVLESEAMSALGVSPVRLMQLFREHDVFRQEELRQLKEASDQLLERIRSLKAEDIGKYSDGLLDIFVGGGTAIVDIPVLRVSTTAGIISITGGLKQAYEGWKKLRA